MDRKKVALVVVDLQKAYQHFRLPQESERLFGASIERALFIVKPAVDLFRERKQSVVFVQHSDPLVAEGSDAFQLADNLVAQPNERCIVKRHPNSFFRTELAEQLRADGVGFVVVCGFAAGGCVDATVQGANERDFGVAILRHGIAGLKDDYVRVSQEIHPTISTEALRFFL